MEYALGTAPTSHRRRQLIVVQVVNQLASQEKPWCCFGSYCVLNLRHHLAMIFRQMVSIALPGWIALKGLP